MNSLYKVYLFFVMAVFLFSLTGCLSASQNTEADQPDTFAELTGLPIVDYLDITNSDNVPKQRKNDVLLVIANKRNDCVYFPYDYGMQIFAYVNNAWTKIPQIIKYTPGENIFVSSRSEGNYEALVVLQPDYSGIKVESPQRIRIVLAGYLCENGIPAEKLTGDYIELETQP